MSEEILFQGWVIYHTPVRNHPVTMRLYAVKNRVRHKVFMTRQEAVSDHIKGTSYTWKQCYRMGWRCTWVNITLPPNKTI